MQALLLSAGEGKRLLPLTKKKPKCLISIYKSTTLKRWIYELEKNNFSKIFINVFYKKKHIFRYIEKFPKKIKKKIFFIDEKKLYGTLGTLKRNNKIFSQDDLLVVHADNYMEENINKFLEKAKKDNRTNFSMLTFYTDDPKNSGIVKLNKRKILVKFYEKKQTSKYGFLANAGIFFIKKKNIKKIVKIKGSDFSKDIIPKNLGKISCTITKKKFADIGTIRKLNEIRKYRKKCFS